MMAAWLIKVPVLDSFSQCDLYQPFCGDGPLYENAHRKSLISFEVYCTMYSSCHDSMSDNARHFVPVKTPRGRTTRIVPAMPLRLLAIAA